MEINLIVILSLAHATLSEYVSFRLSIGPYAASSVGWSVRRQYTFNQFVIISEFH